LVTLIGIRYTTARADSATALDLLLQQWPKGAPRPAPTAHTSLVGGDIDDMEAMRARALRARPASISARSLEALLCNHRTEFDTLLILASAPPEAQRLYNTDTLAAEVTHAANSEMAVHLEDVVLRRTNLGSGSHPGRIALQQAAQKLQQVLGWSDQRREQELQATEMILQRHHAA